MTLAWPCAAFYVAALDRVCGQVGRRFFSFSSSSSFADASNDNPFTKSEDAGGFTRERGENTLDQRITRQTQRLFSYYRLECIMCRSTSLFSSALFSCLLLTRLIQSVITIGWSTGSGPFLNASQYTAPAYSVPSVPFLAAILCIPWMKSLSAHWMIGLLFS